MTRQPIKRISLLVLLMLATVLHISAQQSYSYGLPYMQVYNPKDYDGLGQNWDVLQGDNGLMYFASKTGVLTFDGTHWNTIRLSNLGTVRSLDKDEEGKIYVGGIGDMGYLETDSLGGQKFTSLMDLLPEDIRNSNPDFYRTNISDEGVFFMTPYFAVRYFEGEIEMVTSTEEQGNFNRSYVVNNQVYYLLPVSGLHTYKGGRLQLVSGGEKAANSRSTTSGLIPWGDNELLLIEYTGDALILNDEGAKKATGPALDNLKRILSQVFVAEVIPVEGLGYALNSANDGLIITDETFNVLHHIRKRDGLSDNAVRRGMIDQSGNYWAVTNKGITYIMLNSPFTKADEKTGIDAGLLSATLKNDTLFLGTTWGVKYAEGSTFKQIEPSSLETWDLDVINDQLYGSAGNGVYKINMTSESELLVRGEPWGLVPLPSRPGKYVLHGFNNYLSLLELDDKGELALEAQIQGFWGNVPRMAEDSEGYLWLGDGLDTLRRVKLNDKLDSIVEMRTFGPADGLPRVDANIVLNFKEAKNGVLFIGADHYFEYHAEQDTFLLYEPLDGLVEGDKFRTFEQTPDGNIYTVAGSQKVRFIKGNDGYFLDTTSFAKISEFPAQEIYPLPNNSVLYVGPEGLIQYHPDRVPKTTSTFRTKINEVKSSETVLFGGTSSSQAFLDNGSGLEYKNNSLAFSFGALSFEESDGNQFKYQLVGYDKEWSSWSTTTFKEYTNLPEGNYTFKVRSKNIYGLEGEEAQFNFKVYAPWYRSNLAFGSYGMLVILLVWIIVRAYTHRLLKEKERLERIVEERTHEISMQKDEIAIQAEELKANNEKLVELGQFKEDMTSMIVHDLKNPLSVIIRSGEKKISSVAKRMLNLVLNILDVQKFEETDVQLSLVEGSFNKVIKLAVSDVQDGIDEKNIEFQVVAYEELKTKMDSELMERVIVNLLTNAIKYAPINSKVTAEILVNNEGELYFSVKDQGPGIPADKYKAIFDRYVQLSGQKSGGSRSTGLGLAFCKLVIQAHKGHIGVISETGEGAKFWFTLPSVNAQVLSDQPLVINQDENLSQSDYAQIRSLIPQLLELRVYQSTEIEDLLKQLNAPEGGALSQLIERIINTAFNGDDDTYRTILEEIQNGS
ncbi:ATP-binding protein [Roseivirga sp. E12]|uniref:sensor histidine kinase n=1 Tax=Roseivirga sp. E12 TaxID=2819237 RepID=UPI001ABCA25C|nr:ATP-binding protein [Roseivirga sp. E12]MBO3697679.1 hypothetical protein [Roseivirga sp. E12]